jgi:hypothetical protein
MKTITLIILATITATYGINHITKAITKTALADTHEETTDIPFTLQATDILGNQYWHANTPTDHKQQQKTITTLFTKAAISLTATILLTAAAIIV